MFFRFLYRYLLYPFGLFFFTTVAWSVGWSGLLLVNCQAQAQAGNNHSGSAPLATPNARHKTLSSFLHGLFRPIRTFGGNTFTKQLCYFLPFIGASWRLPLAGTAVKCHLASAVWAWPKLRIWHLQSLMGVIPCRHVWYYSDKSVALNLQPLRPYTNEMSNFSAID